MNFIKFFIPVIITILFLACEGDPKPKQLFEIELAGNTNEYRNQESVAVSIKNKKGQNDRQSKLFNRRESIGGKRRQTKFGNNTFGAKRTQSCY